MKVFTIYTNVASVGSAFNDTRKVKVLSLPETIKEKSTFRAKAFVGTTLSFQVVREALPFAFTIICCSICESSKTPISA